MTTPDEVQPRKSLRPQRATLGAAVGWVAALCLAAFMALVMHSLEKSNQRLADGQTAQATVISRLSAGLDTTRKQLQQHGVKPSAPPAQSIVGGVPGVPGAAGAQGIPGVAGSPGVQGIPGQAGAQGRPGPVSTQPGPAGSPGAAGAQGVPGVAGADGKDGAPGKDGTNGTDGRNGTDGKPAAGWTYTWTDSTGVTHQVVCTRTADSPDSAPYFTCQDTTPTPTPTSSSPTNSGLLGVVMLASSAIYRRI